MTKKTWKRIIISLAVIIVIALFMLPIVAKKIVVKNSKEWTGRQIAIDQISVNYFTGTIRITDFKMFEANEKDVFVSFDTLLVDAEPHRLLINEFVIDKLYLHGLDTKIIFEDSLFNFNDLIAFHSKSDTITNENEKSKPYHFMISNIEIGDAFISLDNRHIDHITNFRELFFLIPFIGWNQEDKSEAGLRFAFKNEGYFESLFHMDPKTGEFDADITINRLYINTFEKYAFEYAEISSIKGILNTHINIDGNVNFPEKAIVSSEIELLDLEMKDQKDKKFLGADKVYVNVKRANRAENLFVIDTIALTKPYVYFELEDSTNNFYEIFNVNSGETDSSAVAKKSENVENTDTLPPLFYAINTFIINEGIIDYTDNLTGNPFDYHLSQVRVNSDSIKSTSEWVTIYSQMLLNDRGTLKAELGSNPEDPLNTNLDFSIEEFQLSDLNIYTNYYVGHSILEGDMFYYSNTKIRNGLIESENKLLVKNATLKSDKKGLYALPLKFALFLLKDKNGDVNLDVPVRGDMKDPTIRYGKLLWGVFKNLIIKAAASPGKLLASIVGGDPKDLEKLEFTYLDTVLSDYHKKQLNLLLELENKKPDLAIKLEYFNDQKLQKKAIAEAETGKLYYKETKKDYLKDEEGFKSYLMSISESDSLDYNGTCLALATPQLVDSLSALFNDYRFSTITNYLLYSNDSNNIKVVLADPDAPENTGSYPIFKIVYSMSDDNISEPE